MVNKARCGAESPITAVNLEEFGLAEDRLKEAAIQLGVLQGRLSICQGELSIAFISLAGGHFTLIAYSCIVNKF